MLTRREQMLYGSIDNYSNFSGDDSKYVNWFLVTGQNRDSDALVRSNFRSILKALGNESSSVRVERFGHWAVGWVEYLYVCPNTEAQIKAQEILDALEDYPVYDENDFSDLESEEANETWKNCFNSKERIEYIRKYRQQFDFRNFQDLREVVRGNYFSGYASELLS